ncbi:MAG TPA: hypothetical protein VF074_16265, partial [Pyrinomonadaceae bacterium]
MFHQKSASVLVTIFVLLLCCHVRAQVPDDTSALRDLTRNFFETFQEKDAEKLRNLWSAKSPDLATFTATMKQKFAEVGTVQLKSLDIRRVTSERDESTVRV